MMNWMLLNLPLVALAAGLVVVPILKVTLAEDGRDAELVTAGGEQAHR